MAYPYQPPLPQQLPVGMMNPPISQLQRRGVQYPTIPTYGRYGEQAVAMANRPPSAPAGGGYTPLGALPPAISTPGGGGGGSGAGGYLSALLSGLRLADLAGVNLGDLFPGGNENAAEDTAEQGAQDTSATNDLIANDLANIPMPTLPPPQQTPPGEVQVSDVPTQPGYTPSPGGVLGAPAGLGGVASSPTPGGTATITEGNGALASQIGLGAAGTIGAIGGLAAPAGTAVITEGLAGALASQVGAGAAGAAAGGGAAGGGAAAAAGGAGAAGSLGPLAATGIGLLAAAPMIVSAFDAGDTARDRRAYEMSRALGLVNVRTVDGRQLIGLPNGTFVEPSGDVSRFLRHESPQATLDYLYSLPTVEHTYQRLPGRQTGKQPRRQED